MLPSIAASSTGHWNHEASRRWQRATVPPPVTYGLAHTFGRGYYKDVAPAWRP